MRDRWAYENNVSGVSIQATPGLLVEKASPTSLNELHQIHRDIVSIFSIIAGLTAKPTDLQLTCHRTDISLALRRYKDVNAKPEEAPFNQFFLSGPFADLSLEEILTRWMRIGREAPLSRSAAIDTLLNDSSINSAEVIKISQGLEAWHRSHVECGRPPPAEADGSTPRRWYLRSRLVDLASSVENVLLPNVPELLDVPFVEKWVNTRNLYTHLELIERRETFEGVEVVFASQLFRCLLRISVLTELGYSESQLIAALGENSRVAKNIRHARERLRW